MGTMFWVRSQPLCASCVEARAGEEQASTAASGAETAQPEKVEVHKLIDPTVCARCSKDNGEIPLEEVVGLPMCVDCAGQLRNFPFPTWVKASFVILLALAIGSFAWNWRFFKAHQEVRAALRALKAGALTEGLELFNSAANRVPESEQLANAVAFYRALLLLSEDKCAEAVPLLKRLRGWNPADRQIGELLLRAEAGEAFEKKDYDAFLELSQTLLKQKPKDPTSLGQVASAYACKYAATGNEEFKREAERYLEEARGLVGPDDESFKEYEERIRHRLKTREVIPRQEYDRRFRGKQPAEEVKE